MKLADKIGHMTTPKKLWIHNVIQSLKEFASKEFQEKGWVKGEVHDYCSYIETICGLFDESVFDDFVDEKAKEFGFSADVIKKLDRFRQAVRSFNSRYSGYEDPKIIINDPEWLTIRALAKDALKSLGLVHYLDPSKEILKDSLLNCMYGIANPNVSHLQCFQERNIHKNPFEEEMDTIFRVCKIENILANYKDYEINEDQVRSLRKFYEALKAYREKIQAAQNFRDLLNDPVWHRIQALAADVIKVFEYEP